MWMMVVDRMRMGVRVWMVMMPAHRMRMSVAVQVPLV